jgi:hypothetical protein
MNRAGWVFGKEEGGSRRGAEEEKRRGAERLRQSAKRLIKLIWRQSQG